MGLPMIQSYPSLLNARNFGRYLLVWPNVRGTIGKEDNKCTNGIIKGSQTFKFLVFTSDEKDFI